MSDPNNTSLIEFNNRTLRIRESAQTPSRLLLMIHGLTGDENSMWVFARDLPKDYWMIAPRAPHNAEPFGYSWRTFQPGTFGRPTFEQLLPAAEALIRLVDEYLASIKIDASPQRRRRIDVMGFSQGAAMSSVLAFLYPDRIRKVGILSGFVPSGMDEHIDRRPLDGKKVFVAHGTKDETVPVDRAHASMEILKRSGAEVVYCEDEVGHKVSLKCLRALRSYLED
jgi:phospholipase/carboxylesterase